MKTKGRRSFMGAERELTHRDRSRPDSDAKRNTFRAGPDESGHFGIFGGRFVAETLMPLILEVEQRLRQGPQRPGIPRRVEALPDPLCRPAQPAVFRRAPDPPFRRRQDLLQARRAEPHRRPQDQQLHGPDPAGPADGQDPDHRRDRRRPARGGDGHGLRPVRPALHRLYGRGRYRAAAAQRVPHEAAGRGGQDRCCPAAAP